MQRHQMGDGPLMLKLAVHNHQAGGDQCAALLLGQVAPHDDVGVAGFVLQCDEGDAAGSAGPLAARYEARNADVTTRGDAL